MFIRKYRIYNNIHQLCALETGSFDDRLAISPVARITPWLLLITLN
jgi:hypothetical protein